VYLGLVGDSAFGSNGMIPVPISRPTIAVTYAGNLQVSTS